LVLNQKTHRVGTELSILMDVLLGGTVPPNLPPIAPPVHKLPPIHHRQTPALESQHRRACSVQIVPKTRALTKFFVMRCCRILARVYRVWNHSIFGFFSSFPSLKYKHPNYSGPDLFPKKLFWFFILSNLRRTKSKSFMIPKWFVFHFKGGYVIFSSHKNVGTWVTNRSFHSPDILHNMKRYDNVTEFQCKLFKLQICMNFSYSLIQLHPNRNYSVSPLQRAVAHWCHSWLLTESYGMLEYLLWARCIIPTVNAGGADIW